VTVSLKEGEKKSGFAGRTRFEKDLEVRNLGKGWRFHVRRRKGAGASFLKILVLLSEKKKEKKGPRGGAEL